MNLRLAPLLTSLALAASLGMTPASARHVDSKEALSYLNPDNDGTIDWREARRSAVRLFHKLDPDRDGTLDLHEFLALVKHRFERANPDQDGTIDARELNTIAGRRLLRVLI